MNRLLFVTLFVFLVYFKIDSVASKRDFKQFVPFCDRSTSFKYEGQEINGVYYTTFFKTYPTSYGSNYPGQLESLIEDKPLLEQGVLLRKYLNLNWLRLWITNINNSYKIERLVFKNTDDYYGKQLAELVKFKTTSDKETGEVKQLEAEFKVYIPGYTIRSVDYFDECLDIKELPVWYTSQA